MRICKITNEKIHLKILPANKNKLINSERDKLLYKQLISLYVDFPLLVSARILSKNRPDLKELKKWIFSKTTKIKDTKNFKYKFFHRIVWIFNGLQDFPRCKTDGKKIGYKDNKKCFNPYGYNEYCCRKCAANNKDVRRHLKQSFMKKYGVDHLMKIPEVKRRLKESEKAYNREKYGNDYFVSTELFLETREKNSLKKYGVKNPILLKSVLAKRKRTVRKKYGVDSISLLEDVKMKRLKTLEDVYGTIHVSFNYDFNGVHFDSSWELYTWIYCKDKKIKITREPAKLFFEYDGKLRGYIPDFKIHNQLVEIKGNQFFLNDTKKSKMIYPYNRKKYSKKKLQWLDGLMTAKHKCMKDNGVEIWLEEEIKPFKKYVYLKYGKDYLKQFRVQKQMKKDTKTDYCDKI